MEEKIREFRQRKRRERLWEKITLKSFMDSWKATSSPVSDNSVIQISPPSSWHRATQNASPEPEVQPLMRTASNESLLSVASSNTSVEWTNEWPPSRLTIVTYGLYTLLWLTCWLIAIQLAFGAVYLLVSGIVAIYLNTRTDPKKPGEISAYSVFNPNCEAIDGTLKAEQFEKEFNLIHHSPT